MAIDANANRFSVTPNPSSGLTFSGLNPTPSPAQLQGTPELSFPTSIPTSHLEDLLNPNNEANFGAYQVAGEPVAGGLRFPSNHDLETYTQKILNYSENQASPQQAREIARSVLAAADEFNVDPKILLATLGHESSFNPGANNGNGKGLGQITQPTRAELDRISGSGPNATRAHVSRDTYARLRTSSARTLFDQLNASNKTTRNRALLSIDSNVRGAAAYMRVMLDTNRGNVRNALSDYNGAGGAIQRAYPGKVASTYRELWGSNMPSTF